MRTTMTLTVAALCGCQPAPAPMSHPPPERSSRPETDPPPTAPAPDVPASQPHCWQQDEIGPREACLSSIAPVSGFEPAATDQPPFGYVCVFFGTRGPKCEAGVVRVVSRWSAASDCPHQLTLYWAPQQNPQAQARELGNGSPTRELEPLVFPSDGSVFGYLRLDDYVLESETCEGGEQAAAEQLLQWGRRLQAEVFPPPG